MEVETVDELYQLNFKIDSESKIIVNEDLLKKINDYDDSPFPKGTEIYRTHPSIYDIHFGNGRNLKINSIPTVCKIAISRKDKIILIYSYNHLKLILKKLEKEYKNPYFYAKHSKKNIYVNEANIDQLDFSYEEEIEIKENEKDNLKIINDIYNNINNIYKNAKNINYEFISPNFKIYYPDVFYENLTDIFDYIYSNDRKYLESNLKQFLKNESEKIFPICGPHNIGKTISSLIIQKICYFEGFQSLYFNLKYYFSNPFDKLDEKIETLTKECFFFVENERELLELYKQLKNIHIIYDIITILKNHFISKKKNNSKFFFILDQYQEKYDLNDSILDQLSDFKIFLISSINDKDVKDNLILTYQEKNIQDNLQYKEKLKKFIRYIYYENLLDFQKLGKDKYLNNIKEKIVKEENNIEKDKAAEKFNFINNILKQFNYIPKYYFGYIYKYKTIYDLLFNEYKHIFIRLSHFNIEKSIMKEKIKELMNKEYLIEKDNIRTIKGLPKDEYIYYLKYIPLKYINYHLNENERLYFYYSFPLFKNILNDFIEYYNSKEIFKISKNGDDKGKAFEFILKIKFRVFNKLNIDGHLEVNSIADMKFTENYKLFDKNYIKEKKNILITQKNDQGKDYDMAIYNPLEKSLLLIQVKYQIEHNLIKPKNHYIDTCEEILANLASEFEDFKIESAYLLYISSAEYNIKRKKTVSNILKKNKLTCLFYSVENDIFTFDFEKKVENLEYADSYMLSPRMNIFEPQKINLDNERKTKEILEEKKEILLGKKISKIFDNDKIYNTLKDYFINKKIQFSFGKIYEIGFIDTNFKLEINREENYVVIFSLKEDDDSIVDLKKQIGLIYYEKELKIYLDVTNNKKYSNFEELFETFNNYYYYGIGNKNSI